MHQEKICLASDNCAPVHPIIMREISAANKGYAPSYGSDRWTNQAEELIRHAFKSSAKVFLLPNGTGANIFALQLACKRHESVLCTDIAHLYYQESGAPESLVGCKLLAVPHQSGKITPEALAKKLRKERAFGKHSSFPRVLSITQPTEVGTVYSLDELHTLSELCKEESLLMHMDGSRLYNAAVALNADLSEIIQAASADLLSLGGTKNGLMGAESLLIFNPTLLEGSDHLHKQTLGLMSKMRYVAAQYIPFFQDRLWHALAKEANQRAQEIAALVQATPHLSLSYPVQTNQIFFTAPASWIPLIQDKILCHCWNQETNELRFITSWNTSKEDIQKTKLVLNTLKD